MNYGKAKCEYLTHLRKEIAAYYGVEYNHTECKEQTCNCFCSACDEETRELWKAVNETELFKTERQAGNTPPNFISFEEWLNSGMLSDAPIPEEKLMAMEAIRLAEAYEAPTKPKSFTQKVRAAWNSILQGPQQGDIE